MMRWCMLGMLLIGGLHWCGQAAAAQKDAATKGEAKPSAKQTSSSKDGTSASSASRTRKVRATTATVPQSAQPPTSATGAPAREAAAMTFARMHHPELADLLSRLKKRKTDEYNRAIAELFQTSERLARTRDRAPDRYEIALEAWKLDSRIRLLAARMTMRNSARLEEQLTKLLRQRVDVRLAQLLNDRERLAGRIERVDEAIEDIRRDPDAAALKDLKRVKRTLDSKTHREKKATPATNSSAVAPNPKPKPSPNPPRRTKADNK